MTLSSSSSPPSRSSASSVRASSEAPAIASAGMTSSWPRTSYSWMRPMMSGSPHATAVTMLVSRTNGGAVASFTGELLVHVCHHAGDPARIGLIAPGLPQAAAAAVPVGLLGHRLVECRGYGCGMTRGDKALGVAAEIRIHGDGKARFPLAHTPIILA